jgi:glycosyltransferase involved in cell wall biosynthesis
MSVPQPSVSLIIPAYNEAARLHSGFSRLLQAERDGTIDLERLDVIYVDDGSTDATPEIASQIAASIPHGRVLVQETNRGKGAAIRAGVASATTKDLAFTDADFAIDPRQLKSLIAALDDNAVAIGSRAVRGHVDYGNPLRTFAGRSFNRLIRSVSKVDFRDTQCGFKALRSAHAKVLFHVAEIQRFAFDVEILARAQSLGWSIGEVAVSWRDVSGSQVHLAKDSIEMLYELIEARSHFSRFPVLLALDAPADLSYGELVRDATREGLHAWPVLRAPSGKRTILATLQDSDEASRRFGALGTAWSTTLRQLEKEELNLAGQDALWLVGDDPSTPDGEAA